MKSKSLNLKRILAKKGISALDLAKMADKTPQWVYNIMNGSPTLTTIEYVADMLGVQVAELFVNEEAGVTYVPCPHCGKIIKMEGYE